MAKTLPATHAEFMEALVSERWYMLTMDTELDDVGDGSANASKWWNDLSDALAYAASRLAGDGFEGEPETQAVVAELMETIGERLIAFGVQHRLRTNEPLIVAGAA